MASSVLRDRIAQRAYEIYESRGGAGGGDLDDWLKAEAELISPSRKRHTTTTSHTRKGKSSRSSQRLTRQRVTRAK